MGREMRLACKVSSIFAFCFLGSLVPSKAQVESMKAQIELVRSGVPIKDEDASNVVLWLSPLSETLPVSAPLPERPRLPLQLVQKHKRFEPHLLVVQVGATVEFPNRDPFFHNVFSLFDGKRFDLGLYEAGTSRTVRFDRRGICYIFCNIHPEMSAVVVVAETPYFGVSDRAGRVVIAGVPPRRYMLHIWYEHSLPEVLKTLARPVVVSAGERSLGTIRLEETADVHFAHKNKYGRDYDPPIPGSPIYVQP